MKKKIIDESYRPSDPIYPKPTAPSPSKQGKCFHATEHNFARSDYLQCIKCGAKKPVPFKEKLLKLLNEEIDYLNEMIDYCNHINDSLNLRRCVIRKHQTKIILSKIKRLEDEW